MKPKIFVLTYLTDYEGETVYCVVWDQHKADSWLAIGPVEVCDDKHAYHVFELVPGVGYKKIATEPAQATAKAAE